MSLCATDCCRGGIFRYMIGERESGVLVWIQRAAEDMNRQQSLSHAKGVCEESRFHHILWEHVTLWEQRGGRSI